MKKQLICPFCDGVLRNASFVPDSLFVYLTCDKCFRKIIVKKEDYVDYVVERGTA